MATVNVAAFAACLVDKRRAQEGADRIRERTLLLLALVGGAAGLGVGMIVAHHKTQKAGFLGKFLAICALHVAIAAALLLW
ncbi:MAG: DUF1294 domain-containing protein [Euryarchaeota archaeon]|nr:DUF1294 domain-containing protein [Euryarchaeota archaeon]